jgi:hypothetical protein
MGVATLTQLDGILLNTKYNIKHLKKYFERDAHEIEVTKVSNDSRKWSSEHDRKGSLLGSFMDHCSI